MVQILDIRGSSSSCCLLLILSWLVQYALSEECGTRFVDPASSTVRASVVFRGSVSSALDNKLDHRLRHSANVTIGEIFKGEEILNEMNYQPRGAVIVDTFGPDVDTVDCVASMSAMASRTNHLFFLRPSQSRGVLQMSALPIVADVATERQVRDSLCEGCVRPPQITRVKCKNCARAPVIKRLRDRHIKTGRRGRLRCTAFGTPPLAFSWKINGTSIVSGSNDIGISSTNKSTTLTIRRTSSTHTGKYTCVAQNFAGEAEKSVDLKVVGATPVRHSNRTDSNIGNSRSGPGRCYYTAALFCLNGGTCHSSVSHSYCNCLPGFYGSNCAFAHAENTATNDENIESVAVNGTEDRLSFSQSIISSRNNTTAGKNATQDQIEDLLINNNGGFKKVEDSVSDNITHHLYNKWETNMISNIIRDKLVNISETSTPPQENTDFSFNVDVNTTTLLSAIDKTSTTSTVARTTASTTTSTPKPSIVTSATASTSKPSIAYKRKRRPKANKRHPAANRVYSNVDDEARKLIAARLKSSRIKASKCRDKTYCLNGAKCRYVHKLEVRVCLCRDGYAGSRCELFDEEYLYSSI